METCKGVDTGSIHCRTLDMCMSSCAECASEPWLHSFWSALLGCVLENCARVSSACVGIVVTSRCQADGIR